MKKIILLLISLLILTGCENTTVVMDNSSINVLDYTEVKELDLDLYSYAYELIDMSNYKVISGKNFKEKIYPASLTKLVTLDAVLNNAVDLNDFSSFSDSQRNLLILEDASLAGLKTNYDYTVEELLYALILPSGADAAASLENYFINKGMNLVDLMNELSIDLGLNCSNFMNTTGLHDDNHYSSLDDICKVVLDILNYEQGRKILETLDYECSDNTKISSTVKIMSMLTRGSILGGKTGFTDESGRSIVTLFRKNNRSYLLLLSNAENSADNRIRHYLDTLTIFNNLY